MDHDDSQSSSDFEAQAASPADAPPEGPLDAPMEAPAPAAKPGPTRLELTREIEALRISLREREVWIEELRRDLEERDASLGWRDQEARAATAEAAAARREAGQFREDRDHARRQLHSRTEEAEQARARTTRLEEDLKGLRAERRKRQEELVELKTALEAARDAHGEGHPSTPDPDVQAKLEETERERFRLSEELSDATSQLQRSAETQAALADELATAHDEAATQSAAAAAGRAREIELLQRLSTQGEELAALRTEVDHLEALLAEERRTSDARIATLSAELGEARGDSDKSAEWVEIASLRGQLAAMRDALGEPSDGSDAETERAALRAELSSRDERLSRLEQELADKSARLARVGQELQELRERGFARYLTPAP